MRPNFTYGAILKFIEYQKLFQFLSGLNDLYSSVKSTILMISPLPSVTKAYALLQQDESQREAHNGVPNFSGESTSLSASSFSAGYKTRSTKG